MVPFKSAMGMPSRLLAPFWHSRCCWLLAGINMKDVFVWSILARASSNFHVLVLSRNSQVSHSTTANTHGDQLATARDRYACDIAFMIICGIMTSEHWWRSSVLDISCTTKHFSARFVIVPSQDDNKDLSRVYQSFNTIQRGLFIASRYSHCDFSSFGGSTSICWEQEKFGADLLEQSVCNHQTIKICSKPAKLFINKTPYSVTRQR